MNWNFWRFNDFLSFKLNSFQWRVIRSWSAKGREEANPVFWLATRAGKVSPSCPFGISRIGPARKKFSFWPYDKSSFTWSFFGKSGWLLASFFLCFYWPQLCLGSFKRKKDLGQYPAILTTSLVSNAYILTREWLALSNEVKVVGN